MNLKLMTIATAMVATAAMAQDDIDSSYEEQTSTEAVEEQASEPAPAPVEEPAPVQEQVAEPAPAPQFAPVAEAQPAEAPAEVAAIPTTNTAAGFDVLRGNAYNPVGNEAAAATIGGNMASPYKMAGSNLVYLEPTGEYAALAFTRGALTYLLAFDNNYNGLGLVTAGFATPAFGVTLDLSIDKAWNSKEESEYEEKTTSDESVTGEGDLIRATFAAPLGAIDVTASLYWETYADETDSETVSSTDDDDAIVKKQTTTIDHDNWDIGGNINVSNGPSAKDIFWSVGANILRHKNYTETETKISYNGDRKDSTDKSEVTGNTAYFRAHPYFNVGTPVLSTSNARVLLGLNTYASLVFYDEIKDDRTRTDSKGKDYTDGNKDNHSIIGLYTMPNVLAELSLGNCWMVFGGANFSWKLFNWSSDEYIENYNSKKDPSDKKTTETDAISMQTYETSVTAGARFQYANFALEASVADSFFSDPLEGFNGTAFIARLGAFINF